MTFQRVMQIAAGYDDADDTNTDVYGGQQLSLFNDYAHDLVEKQNSIHSKVSSDGKSDVERLLELKVEAIR